MANPQASPLLHSHNHLNLSFFRFQQTTHSPPSFTSPHFKKPLLFLPSSFPSQQCNHQVRRVSTVPVEYSTPTPPESDDFSSEIDRLKSLLAKLDVSKEDLRRKEAVVDSDSRVRRFFSENRGGLSKVLGSLGLNPKEMYLVKCVIAAGQEHALCVGYDETFEEEEEEEEYTVRSSVKTALYALVEMIERFDVNSSSSSYKDRSTVLDAEEVAHFRKFLTFLGEIEQFYDCIGGIIGYQVMVLELLHQSSKRHNTNRSHLVEESLGCQYLEMHTPSVLDLTQEKEYASQAALWGIEGLPDLGEIYPLGGAADRLGLVDPETGECLPAAMLTHCGRTLLEGLIRDLQAREFLYFKLYGKQCITPVAIMTSAAKKNHEHVSSLCKRLKWFGRGQSNFQLFEQPLVPAVSAEDGQWIVSRPFVPVSKPGGHGVIWKLAYDKGVFKWFNDHGRKGATVRQVSNVVAATDVTLLALAGIGLRYKKKLGFASCKRNAGATEGINVLMEKKNLDGKWEYGISCIEYTEFDKFGISNRSPTVNGLQADFPANTNILYVDLHSAESIGSSSNVKSLPNMVLNTKKRIEYIDQYGDYHSVMGGRLECTMQNIADSFSNKFPSRCQGSLEDKLDTYIVYNERRRVTSSAKKKKPHASAALHQTPDGALLDILRNAYDLLTECDIKIPMVEPNDRYVDSPPPYLILLHPALGPLWEVSRQKFKGGSISSCSEVQLEIAEFSWNNVEVDGSLIINAENAMGSTTISENGVPILQYGLRCGKCKLHNVKVMNRGIDWNSKSNVYWRNDVNRLETCKIILHGNAEFEASNVNIEGNHVFEVPDGHRLKITSGNSGLSINLEAIEEEVMETGSWYWNYQLNGSHIHLEQVHVSQY